MPRSGDLFPQRRGGDDVHSPLRGLLDFNDPFGLIRDTADRVGADIRGKIETVVDFIRETTGIDLSSVLTLVDAITGEIDFDLAGLQQIFAGIDLTSPGALIAWLQNAPLNAINLINLIPANTIPPLDASILVSGELPMSMITGLLAFVDTYGTIIDNWTGVDFAQLTYAFVPGFIDGTETDFSAAITNLLQILATPDLLASGFDPIAVGAAMINAVLGPTGLVAILSDGFANASIIPPLDASILQSGSLLPALIPNLTSGWGGTIASSLLSGNISQGIIPSLTSGWGGSIASSLLTGVLSGGLIPPIDASTLTGVLAAARIPNLTSGWGGTIASSLLSGAIAQTIIPSLTSGWGGTIDVVNLIGTLLPARLPTITAAMTSGLAALTGGLLSPAVIPPLDGSILTTGTINGSMIGGALNPLATVAGQPLGDIQTTLAGATTAALSAGAASLGSAVALAQQMADQGYAALTGAALAAGKTATDYAAALGGSYAQWINSLKGTSLPSATAPQVSDALAQQAAQQATQAALTAAIQSQLPKFYGGSGTQGSNFNVNFTSTTVLPAGWTDIACALCAKVAKYNTICTSDSETVSGIWSASDYLPKFIILRANAAFTTLVYAKIQNNDPITSAAKCEIGCLNSGVKTVFDTFALPGSGTQQANQAYTFSATAYTFTLTGPGGLSRSYVDGTTTHVSQLGALYRYGGFGNDGVLTSSVTRTTAGNFTFPAGFTTGDKFNVGLFGGYGGGGGGGSGANFGGAGGYGGIGGWGNAAAYGWVYGTDFPLTTTSFAFSPGAAGGGGIGGSAGGPGSSGGSGGTSSLAVTGLTGSPKTVSGGTGGAGGQAGFPSGGGNGANGANGSPGATQYAAINNGYWYANPTNAYGGPGQPGAASPFAAQSFPGGNGGNGAAGSATVDFISTHTLPGTMNNWVFYDSGPSAGPASVMVTAAETLNTTTPSDLATTTDQVTIVVGSTGMVQLDFGAGMTNSAGLGNYMYMIMSGANTAAANAGKMAGAFCGGHCGVDNQYNWSGLIGGLNPGATTFKAKYGNDGSSTATFKNRHLSAIPI